LNPLQEFIITDWKW